MVITSTETFQKAEGIKLGKTSSVCPICLRQIPAERVQYKEDTYLEKNCPEHGFFKTILWRGLPDYRSWMREKIPNHPQRPLTLVDKGCPYDCGFCSSHRQEPCCVLLEVTSRCSLGCPVCFASSSENTSSDPDLHQIRLWYQRMLEAGGPFNIQLSGGEPTLRDDLPEIITMGKKLGFTYFQVNSNGLRLAEEFEYLQKLKLAGLNVVYLQFDGTEDAIYHSIRGRVLLSQKVKAIENCERLHLGVILVPTVVPGINDHNLGDIIKFALCHYPVIRGIHLQPVAYFGRYPNTPANADRITLPELMQKMEFQTEGLVHSRDFYPKGSENSYCSFMGNFIIQPDGSLRPLRQNNSSCCQAPGDAREGLLRSRNFVAKKWVYPEPVKRKLDPSMAFGGWDAVLERAQTHSFSISAMAFQDAWNLDLDLLQDCCIGISAADGKIIPFCAFNLSTTDGRTLYRAPK